MFGVVLGKAGKLLMPAGSPVNTETPTQLFGSPSDLAGGPRETLEKFGANLSRGWPFIAHFGAETARFRAENDGF